MQWLQEITLLVHACLKKISATRWDRPLELNWTDCWCKIMLLFTLQVIVCLCGNLFAVIVWVTIRNKFVYVGEEPHQWAHQTHPLRGPRWQAWSSASDCRWCWSLSGSSCTQTPPGPCTACGSSSRSLSVPKECTTCQNRNWCRSTIDKLTSADFSLKHYLLCKSNSQSFASLLSGKQIVLRSFEGWGRGKNCGSGCRLFFFLLVLQVQLAVCNTENHNTPSQDTFTLPAPHKTLKHCHS